MVKNLEAAVDELNRFVRKEAREGWKSVKSKSKPKTWKGKRVISIEEWKNKEKAGGAEWRKFFPDKFTQSLFTTSDDKQTLQYQDTWFKEYIDFMKAYEDPDCGRLLCMPCILHPDPKPLSTSIRDAIVSTMLYDNKRPRKFPCKVVNVFRCPVSNSLDLLLDRGWKWEQVDNALKYAMELTVYKESLFMADFDRKTIKQYHDDGQHLEHYNLDILTKIQFPRVPIRDHKDLYDAITNCDILSAVLEQFIEFLASDISSETNQKLASYLREDLQNILRLFSKIKEKVKLEELIDPYGRTIQNAKDDSMIFLKDNDSYALPICGMAGACATCSEFSNIRCVLCNAWLCLNHWREHGVMLHKLERPETSKL